MTFHVISLPHVQTTKAYSSCAYVTKVRRFCNMMKSLGHTVYLYAGEENEAECDELIKVATKADQQKWFGDNDFHKNFFNITWNPEDEHWQVMNQRAIEEIKKRIQPKDFIMLVAGRCQKQIADAFPAHMSVEGFIGYTGIFSKYRVYESYAQMHYVQGLLKDDNGHFYDTVIPNYFEVEDFPYSAKKDDYYLFIGRMIPRKGVQVAVEATRRLGAKLVLAGQGARQEGNKIVCDGMVLEGDHLEYVGYADVQKRGELMSKAKATFVPTTYLGPFEGVHVESMLCGTPVITSPFGCFSETFEQGVQGYKCATMGEFVEAAKRAPQLNTKKIRQYAISRYSTEVVAQQYEQYFERLLTLWDEGFYSDKSWLPTQGRRVAKRS